MPSKREKENEARKVKKEGRREKEKYRCVASKPKNEILLSAHARSSQADVYILHPDEKVVKCTTCKRVCGKF